MLFLYVIILYNIFNQAKILLKEGQFNLTKSSYGEQRIIEISSKDVGKITSKFLKDVANTKDIDGVMSKQFENSEAVIRERDKVISTNSAPLYTSEHQVGWAAKSDIIEADACIGCLTIKKEGNIFSVSNQEANTCNDLIEYITQHFNEHELETLTLRFENVPKEQAESVIQSVRIKQATKNIKASVTTKSTKPISGDIYDFAKVTTHEVSNNEIRFTIPKLELGSSNAHIIVDAPKSFWGSIKSIVSKLAQQFRGKKGVDFGKELKKELDLNKIEYKNISTEFDDCIICYIIQINYNYGEKC